MRGPRQRESNDGQPRYHRYVGAELAAVLAEVQRIHGSRAAIVSVDRQREGGVAGFFARETFEVLVDASDAEPGAGVGMGVGGDRGPAAEPPAALSFTDLLARRIEEEERRELLAELAPQPALTHPDPDDWFEPEPRPFEPEPEPGARTRGAPPILCVQGLTGETPDAQNRETPVSPRLGSLDRWTPDQRLLPAPFAAPPAAGVTFRPASRGGLEFWAGYDRACREAELLDLPPVALSAIVGSLAAAVPVVERCRTRHWAGGCDVFLLTDNPRAALPGWTVVADRAELVTIVADRQSEFPLLAIDVPPMLPAWLRPLLDQLRQAGLGRIHYVLDGDPNDEDLATWHGEIGRPAVLDLVGAPSPRRILDLIDRGEPIASVAGVPLSADLLFALRTDLARTDLARDEVSCAR